MQYNLLQYNILFVQFCSPVQSWTAMDSQVPLQLGQRGEIQTTLHTHILLPFLMLQLMGTKLAGVSKASSTNSATAGAEDKARKG